MIILLLMLAGTAGRVLAQDGGSSIPEEKKQDAPKTYLYQWIDDKGIAHITDGLGKVPKKYRSRAQRLESNTSEEAGSVPQQMIVPDRSYSEQEEREADLKEQWQLRVKAARRALDAAEQHHRALEQKRNKLLESIGGPAGLAMGRQLDSEEFGRLEREMKQSQQEVDAAKQELEVTIPDEARKAGVLPGWLRE